MGTCSDVTFLDTILEHLAKNAPEIALVAAFMGFVAWMYNSSVKNVTKSCSNAMEAMQKSHSENIRELRKTMEHVAQLNTVSSEESSKKPHKQRK